MAIVGGKEKILVTVPPDLSDWIAFNATLSSGNSGASGYFGRAVRQDFETADADRLKAFEIWKRIREKKE